MPPGRTKRQLHRRTRLPRRCRKRDDGDRSWIGCGGCLDFGCLSPVSLRNREGWQVAQDFKNLAEEPTEAFIVWLWAHQLLRDTPSHPCTATIGVAKVPCTGSCLRFSLDAQGHIETYCNKCKRSSPAAPYWWKSAGYRNCTWKLMLSFVAALANEQYVPHWRKSIPRLGVVTLCELETALSDAATVYNALHIAENEGKWDHMEYDETFFAQRKYARGSRVRAEGTMVFCGGVMCECSMALSKGSRRRPPATCCR
jgi:hypothetical protein